MGTVEANISMSLDGFVTGPDLDRYPGLGRGGEILHAWTGERRAMDLAMGEERQIAGSVITSRRIFDDTDGWAAENGFFRLPVFVLTHRPHPVVVTGETTFTFVTGGIREAVEAAQAAAGHRVVHIMGGAGVIQQALAAGLVDELFLHVAPVLLGGGTRLFEHIDRVISLERAEVVESRYSTHLRYRVLR
ncbi:MAG: dihydrofolate reductase family protein [Cryobacterium sp.]